MPSSVLRAGTNAPTAFEEIPPEDIYERLISKVRVAADDIDGDGVEGRIDNELYQVSETTRKVMALASKDKASSLTPELLSQRWMIGLEMAKQTMDATTQKGVRNIVAPGKRKLYQRTLHLQYPSIKDRMFSDPILSKMNSTRGNKAAQVFTNGKGFDALYPVKSKKFGYEGLNDFLAEFGVPPVMVTDNAGEETGPNSKWSEICKKFSLRQDHIVPYHYWTNLAEHSIREIKYGIRKVVRRTRAPK